MSPTATATAEPTVDPWAFIDQPGAVAPTTFVKPPPVEADIPLPLRTMCEAALIAATPMRVRMPTEDMAKEGRKLMLAYALARTVTATIPAKDKTPAVVVTGPVTIRVSIQADKVTLNFTVKPPYTPTPKPVIPVTPPTA